MIGWLIFFIILFCLSTQFCLTIILADNDYKYKINVISNLFGIISLLSLVVCVLLVIEIFNNIIA